MATSDVHSPLAPAAESRPAALTDGLRIVLFGLSGAGKSSLLGALAEAAQTQEHLLNGRLNDLSHGLAQLQVRLYDETPRRTDEEVVPYPLAFEPFDDGTTKPMSAVVIDSDGRVAQELIAHPQTLENGVSSRKLAATVLAADTLVLVVDSSATPEQLEQDFVAFEQFLRELEQGRSARVDVGGLPVFLVLTKCDLLAQPGDTAADWMERIEQRKREVDEHFREFLAGRAGEVGSLPFGQLELHLWATAVKRPALAGSPAKPREPYGVAELFRQCFDYAAVYRRRCRQSSRRVFWTTGIAATVAGALVLLALILVFRPPPKPPSKLQIAVESLQFTEKPTPAGRLRAPLSELRQRRERLREIQHDLGFATLPDNLQTFVISRHNELDKYIDWMDQVEAVRRPVTVDTEAGLRDIKQQLEKLGLQADEDWNGTDALRLYEERHDEVTDLLNGIEHVKKAYVGDPQRATKLWSLDDYRTDAGVNWRAWSADLEALRQQFKPVTFKQTDKLPGGAAGTPALTYAAVMRFDTVIDASTLRQRLERERNLAAAFGLIGPLADRPPVLVIEKPPAFKLSMAKSRWQELQKAYPDYKTEFVRNGLPEAMLREVDRAAETNYENLLEPARERVLRELQKVKEEKARWDGLRDWLLSDPEELAAWRLLAVLLARLHDPYAADPVSALAAFLQETTFSLDIKRIVLELPDSVRRKVSSNAALSIYHPKTSGKEPAMVFVQPDTPDRRAAPLTFELKKGQRIVYLPGDDLWATLPLPDNMELTWARNRSERFQFERLLRPPRLHKVGTDNTRGELIDSVRIRVEPPEGWPRVPDLLPIVP